MHIDVNGTRLWFDVDGPALVPDGSQMRQRPTVVLVHGGPGVYDHSYFKPDFARLAEHAQVVYLDLRGHGRSAWGDAAGWSFETCADDVRVFCDSAGIDRPIVFGHSMGGPIVLLYGARHPGHAAGLIVQSGFARWDMPRMVEGFRRVAGDDVAADRGAQLRRRGPARRGVGPRLCCLRATPPGRRARGSHAQESRAQHVRDGAHPPTRHRRSAEQCRLANARLGRSSSTPSHRSPPPKRSPARCPKASRSSRSSTEQATSPGWTLRTVTGP